MKIHSNIIRTIATSLIVFGVYCLSGCTRPEKATSLLTSQGNKDIHITGYDFLGCSKGDFYRTGFTATTRTGQPTSGAVCERLVFGEALVRYR